MEVFQNTFHRRSFSIDDVVKSYREKKVLKLYGWSLLDLTHAYAGPEEYVFCAAN